MKKASVEELRHLRPSLGGGESFMRPCAKVRVGEGVNPAAIQAGGQRVGEHGGEVSIHSHGGHC